MILRLLARLALLLVLVSPAGLAFAVNPDEVLKDPAMEARARALSANLRCLVCQNQSIDDSNADLAKDLRLLLRERIKAGDSDEQVIAYLVSRYGEFVLLKPRLTRETIILWSAPFAFLIVGGGLIWLSWRRRQISSPSSSATLTAAEEARIQSLLKED